MKRDLNLVREILFAMEDAENPDAWARIQQLKTMTFQGDTDRYPGADALHITWMGYEFLDAARQQTLWDTVRKRVGAAGLTVIFEVLKGQAIRLALGEAPT